MLVASSSNVFETSYVERYILIKRESAKVCKLVQPMEFIYLLKIRSKQDHV